MTKLLRKILLDDGTKILMENLKVGDIFEIYEPDGEQVGDKWIATSDGYIENEIGIVETEKYNG